MKRIEEMKNVEIQTEIANILIARKGSLEAGKAELKKITEGKYKTTLEMPPGEAETLLRKLRQEESGGEAVEPSPKPESEPKKENDLIPVPHEFKGPLAVGVESFERAMVIMEKVREYGLKKLKSMSPSCFVIFGDTVCLKGKGADEFLSGLPLPLELKNVEELSERKDAKGYAIFRFQAEAINTITGMSIPVYSETSSGKDFYTTRYTKDRKKYHLSPDQVNTRDVRVDAHRGLRKEAVKLFFGLRGLTTEEASEKGLKVSQIQRVDFKK